MISFLRYGKKRKKEEAERIADSGTGAVPQMQQETGGSEGTGTDKVSKVQSTGGS